MDLVRRIAMFFEELGAEWMTPETPGVLKRNNRHVAGLLPDIPGFSEDEIRHAVNIMTDASLLVSNEEHLGGRSGFPTVVLGRRLGWQGHEFLASVKDDETYDAVKDLARKAGNWTIGFFIDVAKAFALKKLGL